MIKLQTDALHATCGRRKLFPNEVKHIFISQEITAQIHAP